MIEQIMPDKIHPSWKEFICNNKVLKCLNKIASQIGTNYYPDGKNVLRFLNTNLNKVKYVIVGMDPYSTSYVKDGKILSVATGRSFELDNIDSWNEPTKNKSLINILKSIYDLHDESKDINSIRKNIENNKFSILKPKELFDDLENQGILFLNTAFTVIPNSPGSHLKIWEPFFEMLKNYIIEKQNPKWVLWGNKAISKIEGQVDYSKIISNCHPRLNKFIDNNNFKEMPDICWIGRKK